MALCQLTAASPGAPAAALSDCGQGGSALSSGRLCSVAGPGSASGAGGASPGGSRRLMVVPKRSTLPTEQMLTLLRGGSRAAGAPATGPREVPSLSVPRRRLCALDRLSRMERAESACSVALKGSCALGRGERPELGPRRSSPTSAAAGALAERLPLCGLPCASGGGWRTGSASAATKEAPTALSRSRSRCSFLLRRWLFARAWILATARSWRHPRRRAPSSSPMRR
mmetsp:Transcript_19129/g.64081  ORF Transcript_19129/g.64081 Transcript_19129/m.64081 type:complete len:227 (-) Transcript_19129:158-838(-)